MSDTPSRSLIARVTGLTGLDALIVLLPLKMRIKHIARKFLKPGNFWHGADPDACALVLETEWGTFRVVDRKGNVVPWKKETQGF